MKNRLMSVAVTIAMLAGTAGIAAAQDYRYYDRDDNRYYDRDDYGRYGGYNFLQGMHEAREFGFRDGAQVARDDMWRGKRFNPNPRGPYDDADHGYQRAFGDRHEYREHYTEAYRRGYESTFRGGGYNNYYYQR